MLVLSRKVGQKLVIDGDIHVVVQPSSRVVLGLVASGVGIMRGELRDRRLGAERCAREGDGVRVES